MASTSSPIPHHHQKESRHDHDLQGRTGHRRPDVELPGAGFRAHPDKCLRSPRRRTGPHRHGCGRRDRGLHDSAAVGHRPGRPALDLAHPHGFRPHRVVAPVAGREPSDPRHHHLPRGRHHGPVSAPADGSCVPGQPRPDNRRGRPHPQGGEAADVRQPDHHRICTTTAPAPSSAPTASARSSPTSPRARRTSPTTSSTRVRSSGRPSTRRGSTRSTGRSSPSR